VPLGVPNTPECRREWADARETCGRLIRNPGNYDENSGIRGGYTDIEQCARGLVSEECGGNPVQE